MSQRQEETKMQKLTLAGTIGRDGELRQTQGGEPVLGFSLAVDNGKDKNGQKRDATWYDCTFWGKRATSLEPYMKKGMKLALTGRPTVRVHNDKPYLGCSVDDFTFMGGGDRSQSTQQKVDYNAPVSDDEIPF
jgi:single-strand DNA-binding protein